MFESCLNACVLIPCLSILFEYLVLMHWINTLSHTTNPRRSGDSILKQRREHQVLWEKQNARLREGIVQAPFTASNTKVCQTLCSKGPPFKRQRGQKRKNSSFHGCKFSPCSKCDLNVDFDGETQVKITLALPRGRAPPPPTAFWCFLCIRSLGAIRTL